VLVAARRAREPVRRTLRDGVRAAARQLERGAGLAPAGIGAPFEATIPLPAVSRVGSSSVNDATSIVNAPFDARK
jgi:hypothetical protein